MKYFVLKKERKRGRNMLCWTFPQVHVTVTHLSDWAAAAMGAWDARSNVPQPPFPATPLLRKLSPVPVRLELHTPGHAPRWSSPQRTSWACPGLASPLMGQPQPQPILMGAHATPWCWHANMSRTVNRMHHTRCWPSLTEHIPKGRKISLTKRNSISPPISVHKNMPINHPSGHFQWYYGACHSQLF